MGQTINQRIEDAVTKAVCEMRVPKTIFLGKAEMAQHERETTGKVKIVLSGSPKSTQRSLWRASGAVDIVPTEAESEFRLESDPPAEIK